MMKKEYVAPKIEDLGALADMTRNGFSKGNDIGKGKSGGGSGPSS
ncbi:MAG: hypothetical protein ACR2PZ_13695 [Pseudomonadales bacterium]